MTRRHVLLALAGVTAAALGSSLVRAAEPGQRVVRVGLVHPQSPSTANRGVTAFWERLHALGWVERQNLVTETRWADGQVEKLPSLMVEVLGHNVDVLVTNTTPAAAAAKRATSTVPIVCVGMAEPLRTGLATSLARPGSNLTGLSLGFAEGIGGKWLELLQETVPRLSHVAVIENPDTAIARDLAKELEAIAPVRGLYVQFLKVDEPRALDRAFEHAGRRAQAALVLPAPFISAHRGQIAAMAAKYRLPTMYYLRDFVDAGGLIAYAPDLAAQWQRAADYVDKILRGAKPADLPIEEPTKFELVVNLKTAKALGITVPESVLVRADEIVH